MITAGEAWSSSRKVDRWVEASARFCSERMSPVSSNGNVQSFSGILIFTAPVTASAMSPSILADVLQLPSDEPTTFGFEKVNSFNSLSEMHVHL